MSTFCADGLIPARFLSLIAHFIMLVMALNHRVRVLKIFLSFFIFNTKIEKHLLIKNLE